MQVYTIVENGEQYPTAYATYAEAVQAVKTKHKERLDEEEAWSKDDVSCNELDVPEAKSGPSMLYIEKGIHIEIHRLPVETPPKYSLEDLFLIVSRCSFHVTDKQKNQLFQEISSELEERYSVEREALREAMKIPDLELEEHCIECNSLVEDWDPDEHEDEPVLCSACKK